MIRNMTTALKAEDELRDSIRGMKRKAALAHLEELERMAAERAQYEWARACVVVREELEERG